MDVMHSCGCCLRCLPDRDLTTPYSHLGTTEIYSDMLKECFDLHLTVGGDGSCGICSACVGRLRDASDFKLQVQRSQAELRARLQGALRVKEEESAVKTEMEDADWSSEVPVLGIGVVGPVVTDMALGAACVKEEQHAVCADTEPGEESVKEEREWWDGACGVSEAAAGAGLYAGHRIQGELVLGPDTPHRPKATAVPVALDGCAGRPVSALASSQLALTSSARLEHLRGDEAPLHESRRANRGKKPFSCEECNKQFAQKNHLVNHKRCHTGEKPYKCEECDKQFTEKSHLERHKKIHTGEKRYRCEECNKRFTENSSLILHLRIHTGEKPFSCEECNKHFTQKAYLDTHKRMHTGEKLYSCEECNKKFTQKSNLKVHKRIHTGEKPYRCEECNKQFTQRGTFMNHLRTHSGEKPFSCEECNKQFTQKSNLILHLKTHGVSRTTT